MKIQLTRPWELTVLPHRVWKRMVGEGRVLPSPSELPPLGAPCTPEGVVTVPATVPGNFELDLYRAGVIPDPFYGTNITGLRNLEDRHLYYVTTFDAPAGQEAVTLHFEGVDTVAEVYVNGHRVGECDNMFIPWDFPLTDLKPTDNQLVVHILPAMMVAQDKPVPPAAGAFDHSYASLGLRKAPSSFGWDIPLPRRLGRYLAGRVAGDSQARPCAGAGVPLHLRGSSEARSGVGRGCHA